MVGTTIWVALIQKYNSEYVIFIAFYLPLFVVL